GGQARLSAKVYDVSTRQQLRLVSDQVRGLATPAALDSLLATFRRLAPGLLGVPGGSGGAFTTIGTTSLAAYEAYTRALTNQGEGQYDSLVANMRLALRLDPTFALAHLRLGRWLRITRVDTTEARAHVDSASRYQEALLPMDRLRIRMELATT